MAEFKPSYLVRGLPGHPLHPPLTDATIGIYTFATVAAVLSKLGVADHALAQAWWLALVIGLVTTVLTALTGLVDWLQITRGTELWKTATLHLTAMLTATVFFLLAALFGHGCYTDHRITTGPFILTLVGFVCLSAGGWLGGAITYVHGMRVLSLPDESALKAIAPVPTAEKVEAEEA
ncbi:MAG: hypothetical protein QOH95_2303 [Gaiellaceae bacterium]|nr:hypothetical protein [Gaiellaceae bacterium]